MILDICKLTAGYGRHLVLRDIDLSVDSGEVVAVLGTNGAGKSTLLRTIAGLQPARHGSLSLNGTEITRLAPHLRVQRGLAFAPEGQQSFPNMSVEENLLVAARSVRRGESRSDIATAIEEVVGLFPKLGHRMQQWAGTLSGGERQMLSISRALLARPDVLMLDEPSHGLAPVVIEQLTESIASIATGVAVLLVEQNLFIPRYCATKVVVLENSRIVAQGGRDLVGSDEVVASYLGIG